MHIIDSEGKKIEVTDLDLAIMQADDYRHYRFSDPALMQHPLYDYWEDFYQKLLTLQTQVNSQIDG
ncbi:3-isopropylmalate dehydratase [Mucilaginibacter sp. SMC90]|uniref:3-isopropylmalate dehydratase n=1 Tax=Mucilaginibacter sp. SMC90 TaxID=2929803 RepID=UPI001FB27C82|nr:3-isopropylmalate dehydratase [Mucilaginibacter sp. SMC90]UOE52550.1 3-isopropylmalate dehydratase [Mucilaginibacter sp. SMC90]